MADTLYENDDGLVASLDSKTGKLPTAMGTGILRLFTAPILVNQASVLADFTEATFPGYANVTLQAASWSAAAVAAHVASSSYPGVTFTRNQTGTGQTIRGWYLTNVANTKLYASANFGSGPFILAANGDAITVTITLTDESKN